YSTIFANNAMQFWLELALHGKKTTAYHSQIQIATPGPGWSSYMELESHPLDTNDRRELLRQEMGIGFCNITKCCTEVCPEHIKITDNAIIPLKERVVDASYDPISWLGRKITRRTKKSAAEAANYRTDPMMSKSQ
ncbi:MAG: hypothetical protein M1288_01180, partial [Actinobacteria bacterium]|nr:hypothetical protein [Actinomycetota bacterium]